MTHLDAIRAELLADPTVVGLIVDRVYALVAPSPPNHPVGPFVILTVVSSVPFATHTEPPDELLEDVRVQVDSYASTYRAAHELANAVDNVIGALSRPEFSATKAGERDLIDEEPPRMYRVNATYFVLRSRD